MFPPALNNLLMDLGPCWHSVAPDLFSGDHLTYHFHTQIANISSHRAPFL